MKQFRFVHASGDTFMSLARTKSDIGHLVDLDPLPLWITLTETAEASTIEGIRDTLHKLDAPFRLVNPDRGDISFLVNHDAHVADSGGPLAIPRRPGPARTGGHGPRHNSYVELHWRGEVISVNGVHLVTYHPDHEHDTGTRGGQQVRQVELLGQQMRTQAHRRNLSVGSGDLNGQLPNRDDLQHIFDEYGMTTTAHETGVMTGTHGNARIDYAWTMDKDSRLHVVEMKVLKSRVYNSDHDPIVNDCELRG